MWSHRGSAVWFFGYDAERSAWRWSSLPSPGGPVGGLAVAESVLGGGSVGGEHLFALVYDGGVPPRRSRIMALDRYTNYPEENWREVYSTTDDLRSLFGAHRKLFAGARRSNDYAILAFDVTSTGFAPPGSADNLVRETIYTSSSPASLVRGVIERGASIYFAQMGTHLTGAGSSILVFPATLASVMTVSDTISVPGVVITGMIKTPGDEIVVVGNAVNQGRMFLLPTGAPPAELTERTRLGNRLFFSGGMSVWRANTAGTNVWEPSLLLLGTWASGLTNRIGYREMNLTPLGNVGVGTSPIEPGNPPENGFSSVGSNARYRASIGTRAVQGIFQVPYDLGGVAGAGFFPDMMLSENEGWQPPIFASTARDGMWVYYFARDRWNAEDNSINWR